MAGNSPLVGPNLKKSLEMLHEITDLLDQHQIKYSLDGGTALGIVRENRLLPWDTDMDITINSSFAQSVIQLLKQLPFFKYRFRIRKLADTRGPMQRGCIRLIKVWRRKYLFFKGDQLLDIFINYSDQDNIYWALGSDKDEIVLNSMPIQFHQNLKQIFFDKKHYWIPAEEDAFLTYRYGDWRTPVKEWNAFTQDGALTKNLTSSVS